MRNEKIEKLLARQEELKKTIKEEVRHAKTRKQKALFGAVQRVGLLDLTDDEIEAALRAYQASRGGSDNGGESQT